MLKLHKTTQWSYPRQTGVAITFVTQKNAPKNNTITQWRTNDNVLCPVTQRAQIVTRIRSYPISSPSTPVSATLTCGILSHITSKDVESALRDGVVAIVEDRLRIWTHDIGTHSIRSGAAMAMYLGGIPVFAIMMIGLWQSMAFMNYIRKQINEFTLGVSTNMLTLQPFCHTPPPTTQTQPTTAQERMNMAVWPA